MQAQFKVTFRNQIKALEFTLFIIAFLIALLVYFKYDSNVIFISTIIFLAQFIPVLYLHFEYLRLNRDSSLIINSDLLTVKFFRNRQQMIDLSFNQIAKIALYLPPSAYRGIIERKIQFLPIEPYGYAVIYSKAGDKALITSLMIPDILSELGAIEGVIIDKKKGLFASPSFEKIIQWFLKDGL